MKKCPYCAEEIQDDAVKCKHCGETLISPEWRTWVDRYTGLTATGRKESLRALDSSQRQYVARLLQLLDLGLETPEVPVPSRHDPPTAQQETQTSSGAGLGLLLFSVGVLAIALSWESSNSLLLLGLGCGAGFIAGLWLFRRGRKQATVIMAASLALTLVAAAGYYSTATKERAASAQANAEEEAERKRVAELVVNKESNYSAGLEFMAAGQIAEALEFFVKVEQVDPNYADLTQQIERARKLANDKKEQSLLAELKQVSDPHAKVRLYEQLNKLRPESREYALQLERNKTAAAELDKQRVRKRVEEQRRAAAKLEVLDWTWSTEHGYAKLEGQVRNRTSASLRNVAAVATYYTSDGTFITSDSALIDYNPILPGQTSPFSILTQENPAMKKASLNFKKLLGGTIPWAKAE